MSDPRFLREESLLGTEAVEALRSAHVAVFGLGGVGSWAAEALARAGVGTLTLVDFDTVSVTNINRQLYALESTVGCHKAELAAARIRDICPDTRAIPRVEKYEAATRDALLSPDYDYIVDAIDLVSCKLDLICAAQEKGIPILSCLGTGNRLHAEGFRVTDLAQTRDDPLARVLRRELRRRGVEHTQVLWAPGTAEKPGETAEEAPQGRRSIPGSVSWVPATAGLRMAEHVVLALIGGPLQGRAPVVESTEERKCGSMERIVLSPLAVHLDRESLMEKNHIPADSDLAEDFADLVEEANRVLRCKTVLVRGDEPVSFPLPEGSAPAWYYAMTVGREIEEDEDCDYPYLGDVVRQAALDAAMEATQAYLREQQGMKGVAFLNPGSEGNWEDKRINLEIVSLTGAEEIGIQVDDRGNMTPWYSTVGIFTEA